MKEKRIGGSCLFTTTEKKRSRKVREKEPADPTFVFCPIWVEMEGNLH